MKNTTWQRVEPGQIVKFSYKSMNSKRGEQRVILIIDPKYRYKKKSTNRIVEYGTTIRYGVETTNKC